MRECVCVCECLEVCVCGGGGGGGGRGREMGTERIRKNKILPSMLSVNSSGARL